jgi:uncharacterized damage-inducible protein DinB
MAASLVDQYRRWFEYEKNSHAKVLASLESVPHERRSSPVFQKALTTLAHVAAARQLWLYRFGVLTEAPTDFFPTGLTVADVAGRIEKVQAAWSKYLENLHEEELARLFTYESLDGGWWRSRIEDILTQLFGHSWYHRGQIASLVRQAGGEPAITDFVYWTRESVPSP